MRAKRAQYAISATPWPVIKQLVFEPPNEPFCHRRASLGTSTKQWPHPVKKRLTEHAGLVDCACNYHPTAATLLFHARVEDKVRNKPELRSRKRAQVATKTENKRQEKAKSGTVSKEDVQITAESKEQKKSKRPDEAYRNIFSFPEICKILLFTSTNYKVSDSIGRISSGMRPVDCFF